MFASCDVKVCINLNPNAIFEPADAAAVDIGAAVTFGVTVWEKVALGAAVGGTVMFEDAVGAAVAFGAVVTLGATVRVAAVAAVVGAVVDGVMSVQEDSNWYSICRSFESRNICMHM